MSRWADENARRINSDTGRYPGDLGPQPGTTREEIERVLLFLSAAEWRPAPLLVELGEAGVGRALAIAHQRGWIFAFDSRKRGEVVYRLTPKEHK